MKIISSILLTILCLQLYARDQNPSSVTKNNSGETTNMDTIKLKITIGTKAYTVSLYNNATVTAFKKRLPLTIDMTELNGNEKYADISGRLPRDAASPGTIQTGDVMLYGSSTLVLFYKTFSTSYSYTRIGRVDDASGLAKALGSGNVTVKFEL